MTDVTSLKSKTEVAILSNKLIEARSKHVFSLHEQKMLLKIISSIGKDEGWQEIKFTKKEISETLQIPIGNVSREAKKIITGLREKAISIQQDDGDWFVTGWISSGRYKDSVLSVKLGDQLEPYLLHLKQSFTPIVIKNILSMVSCHSIRIYMILRKDLYLKKFNTSIEDLKQILGVHEKYKLTSDFRLNVLEVAKKEINELADISVDYQLIKTGKKITDIEFNISDKSKINVAPAIDDIDVKKIDNPIEELNTNPVIKADLMLMGLSKEKINDLLQTYEISKIEKKICFIKEKISNGASVENPAGLLISALIDDYNVQSSDDFKENINKQSGDLSNLKLLLKGVGRFYQSWQENGFLSGKNADEFDVLVIKINSLLNEISSPPESTELSQFKKLVMSEYRETKEQEINRLKKVIHEQEEALNASGTSTAMKNVIQKQLDKSKEILFKLLA